MAAVAALRLRLRQPDQKDSEGGRHDHERDDSLPFKLYHLETHQPSGLEYKQRCKVGEA
jgi:hypothetical protein